MNTFGKARAPFLFLVDFEMKSIRIFPLESLPGNFHYEFRVKGNQAALKGDHGSFTFRKFPMPFEEYQKAFETVQKHIHAGNTFLANLTFPTPVESSLTLQGIYHRCCARYRILVEDEFVCFSPETFVTIKDGIISTFPMKGTKKVLSSESAKELLADGKETAEHNTIVDLLRNDLSMVASAVKVKRFRYIDRIVTHEGELLQVSSEITGELTRGYPSRIGDILFTLLPAGSVTGAPKKKTVDVIREAEQADRGYYTGVCGVFDGNNLDSAVLIRLIENHNGVMRFRSGGGITFLSEAQAEYDEMKDKVYVPVA